MTEQYLLVNNAQSAGSVAVDQSRIRGEGGPKRPQLVIPATVAMAVCSDDSALALTELRASLRPETSAFPWDTVGRQSTLDLADGFLGWSRPDIENKHPIELRISMSSVDVEEIEHRRHLDPDGRTRLALFLDPVVEGVRHFNQQLPGRESLNAGPWDQPRFGMYSQRFTFWSSTIQPIPLTIEMSQWVEAILPALGYNQLRLIELVLPPALPGHNAAAIEFDKARLAFDQRRYAECVAACRGLVAMWNRLLGADKSNQLGSVIGDRLHWPEGDKRRTFLTETWVAVIDMVNVPPHPEGQPNPQHYSSDETRLIFREVAVLSEFLSSVSS